MLRQLDDRTLVSGQIAPDQRLAAGQPELPDALVDEDRAQPLERAHVAFGLEQLARDAKALQIYGGTDEMQITHIAKDLLRSRPPQR